MYYQQAQQTPTREEVEAEIARRQQARRSAALAQGGQITLQDVEAELARRRQAQAPPPPPPPRTMVDEITGAVAAAGQGTFPGFHDELSGVIGGGIDALAEAGNQIGLGRASPGGIPGAYLRGYEREANAQRSALRDFRQERPNAAAFAEGTGGAVPIIATLGASAPEQVVAQVGSRGMLTRMGQGAATGGLYGGIYGIGEADGEDLQTRLTEGLDNAAWGAAFGAAAPVAVAGAQRGLEAAQPVLDPLWQRVWGAAERIPTPAPNTVGALGGNLGARSRFSFDPPPPPAPPQPPAERIPPPAAAVIERLAGRMRMGPEDVGAAAARARGSPQGQVLADIFGDPGIRTTRTIAQAPGETGELAAQVAENRSQEAPSRITEALRRSLGVSESRAAAIERLGADYDAVSANLYQPLWQQPVTPQQTAIFEQRIAPLLEDPIMQRAMRRGEAIFERDRRLGLMDGDVQENLPRYLHLIKMGLDDEIAAARRDATGIQATEMRGVMELRRRFIAAVDDMVPGYREARARWGGIREAEDALEEGAGFLRLSADEVQARMAEMSPFQREHARIGLADELTQRVGLAGNTVGNVNVANIQAFRSPEMQARIRAAFDSPQQAADFLDTVTAQNRLMRSASQWGGGSQTYSNILHGEDAGAAFAEAAGEAARGEPGRAVMRISRQVGNLITDNAIEEGNNQTGRVLLRRIDSEEARAFTDQVVQILRERQARRQAQVLGGQVGGVAAGDATGRGDSARDDWQDYPSWSDTPPR